MPFLKHIGKHNDRKVVVLWRKVPNEDHMCLVIFPEVLQAAWHDTIMKVLESPAGQQAENFADTLHRAILPDGRLILETLHLEQSIKKIRTADVLMTPVPNTSIRLDELNSLLDKMAQGEEAIRELAENDAARGLVDPAVKRRHEDQFKAGTSPLAATADTALSDADIAANQLQQAEAMEREAKAMIAEAARMKKEAARLFPRVSVPKASTAVAAEPVAEAPPKKTRTRKPKVTNATQ